MLIKTLILLNKDLKSDWGDGSNLRMPASKAGALPKDA